MIRSLLFTLTLILATCFAKAQDSLYVKTFGLPTDKAIVFLHGGPGYNCSTFEASTAAVLAKRGFFVIVYDRRGEGRSTRSNAEFSFAQSMEDIDAILDQYQLQKASFIGHSFGGMLAVKYAEANPQRVETIHLVGAPVNLQASFTHIIQKCTELYTAKNDTLNLKYIEMLQKMDTSALMYGSYCFMHAMNNGFYSPKEPTKEALDVMQQIVTSPVKNYFSKMEMEGPMGFWKNERYTTLDLSSSIKLVLQNGVKIVGIYGEEDGLYSKNQLEDLRLLIGRENVVFLSQCSHSVFIDQQAAFLDFIVKYN